MTIPESEASVESNCEWSNLGGGSARMCVARSAMSVIEGSRIEWTQWCCLARTGAVLEPYVVQTLLELESKADETEKKPHKNVLLDYSTRSKSGKRA